MTHASRLQGENESAKEKKMKRNTYDVSSIKRV